MDGEVVDSLNISVKKDNTLQLTQAMVSVSGTGKEADNFIEGVDNKYSALFNVAPEAYEKFKQAIRMDNRFDYATNRISDIIQLSPEIKKQLLVIDARRNRKQYTTEIELAKFYFDKGDLFKAMRLFERTGTIFKDDTVAKGYLKRLKLHLVNEIEVFMSP